MTSGVVSYRASPALKALRVKVQSLTALEVDVQRHIPLVSSLPGHTIRPVPPGDPRSPSVDRYNCFAYAFDLAESADFRFIAGTWPSVHADSEFASFLMQTKRLVAATLATVADGDIVVYFHEGAPAHGGKVFSLRVISKWGIGLLWDHEMFEIPVSYGDTAIRFNPLSPAVSRAAFLEYTAEKGIDVERSPQWRSRESSGA